MASKRDSLLKRLSFKVADVDSKLERICTVTGNVEKLKALVKKYNKKDSKKKISFSVLFDGWTPLQVAAFNLHREVVEFLVAENSAVNAVDPETGCTVLHMAAWRGDLSIVRTLVEQGNASLNARAKNEFNALHFAVCGGSLEVVSYLITMKARLKAHSYRHGFTPFHLACLLGHLHIVEYFLKNTAQNVDSKDASKSTGLHQACKEGFVDIVMILLRAGADATKVNCHGVTPPAVCPYKELYQYVLHWSLLTDNPDDVAPSPPPEVVEKRDAFVYSISPPPLDHPRDDYEAVKQIFRRLASINPSPFSDAVKENHSWVDYTVISVPDVNSMPWTPSPEPKRSALKTHVTQFLQGSDSVHSSPSLSSPPNSPSLPKTVSFSNKLEDTRYFKEKDKTLKVSRTRSVGMLSPTLPATTTTKHDEVSVESPQRIEEEPDSSKRVGKTFSAVILPNSQHQDGSTDSPKTNQSSVTSSDDRTDIEKTFLNSNVVVQEVPMDVKVPAGGAVKLDETISDVVTTEISPVLSPSAKSKVSNHPVTLPTVPELTLDVVDDKGKVEETLSDDVMSSAIGNHCSMDTKSSDVAIELTRIVSDDSDTTVNDRDDDIKADNHLEATVASRTDDADDVLINKRSNSSDSEHVDSIGSRLQSKQHPLTDHNTAVIENLDTIKRNKMFGHVFATQSSDTSDESHVEIIENFDDVLKYDGGLSYLTRNTPKDLEDKNSAGDRNTDTTEDNFETNLAITSILSDQGRSDRIADDNESVKQEVVTETRHAQSDTSETNSNSSGMVDSNIAIVDNVDKTTDAAENTTSDDSSLQLHETTDMTRSSSFALVHTNGEVSIADNDKDDVEMGDNCLNGGQELGASSSDNVNKDFKVDAVMQTSALEHGVEQDPDVTAMDAIANGAEKSDKSFVARIKMEEKDDDDCIHGDILSQKAESFAAKLVDTERTYPASEHATLSDYLHEDDEEFPSSKEEKEAISIGVAFINDIDSYLHQKRLAHDNPSSRVLTGQSPPPEQLSEGDKDKWKQFNKAIVSADQLEESVGSTVDRFKRVVDMRALPLASSLSRAMGARSMRRKAKTFYQWKQLDFSIMMNNGNSLDSFTHQDLFKSQVAVTPRLKLESHLDPSTISRLSAGMRFAARVLEKYVRRVMEEKNFYLLERAWSQWLFVAACSGDEEYKAEYKSVYKTSPGESVHDLLLSRGSNNSNCHHGHLPMDLQSLGSLPSALNCVLAANETVLWAIFTFYVEHKLLIPHLKSKQRAHSKRIMSVRALWALLHDFGVCPVLCCKLKLHSIVSTVLHAGPSAPPPPTPSQVKLNQTAAVLSFHSYLKVLWAIARDCLDQEAARWSPVLLLLNLLHRMDCSTGRTKMASGSRDTRLLPPFNLTDASFQPQTHCTGSRNQSSKSSNHNTTPEGPYSPYSDHHHTMATLIKQNYHSDTPVVHQKSPEVSRSSERCVSAGKSKQRSRLRH